MQRAITPKEVHVGIVGADTKATGQNASHVSANNGLMRAMVFDRYGEPGVMQLKDVPIPEPQDREVLIRVGYAGVNPADTKARAGHSARGGYRYREVGFPFVTGMDAAGIVERTGSHAEEFRQGDRVITWSAANGRTWGSYAEFMRVPLTSISPMPKSLNFAQAAAVPIASLTAFQALFHTQKGGHDPGPEGAHTRGGRWRWRLRRTICEERRAACVSDLQPRERGVCPKPRCRSCN
jgi:hypothetical protein